LSISLIVSFSLPRIFTCLKKRAVSMLTPIAAKTMAKLS
jgi:tetrahydromethanopterin S-methyltransferase subunit C